MKEEQVLELMGQLSPDLIEEADVAEPTGRRLPKLVRTGLIAACLCLILVGTACAATAAYRLMVQSSVDEEGILYEVFGFEDAVRYPMSSFSQELQTVCQSGEEPDKTTRYFDSREEAQAYLGEAIPMAWPDYWPRVMCMILPSTRQPARAVSVIYAAGFDDGASFTAQMGVYTENCPEEDVGMEFRLRDISAPPERYEMADGTEAVIYCGSGWCTSVFVKSGIVYRASVDGRFADVPIPVPELKARLCAVLDSFS